jgi:hypothetical protein
MVDYELCNKKKNDDASIKMDFCCTWMNKKNGKDNR